MTRWTAPIPFPCPRCAKPLRVTNELDDKKGNCPALRQARHTSALREKLASPGFIKRHCPEGASVRHLGRSHRSILELGEGITAEDRGSRHAMRLTGPNLSVYSVFKFPSHS